MDERPVDPDLEEGGADPARPTPVSVRDALRPAAVPRKPTPARAMSDGDPVAATPDRAVVEVEEVSFEVDATSVIARPLGRSGRAGSPPLLLIGFWRVGTEEADHERESLVVARDLGDVGEDALRSAWNDGREPPAPPGAPPPRSEQWRRR